MPVTSPQIFNDSKKGAYVKKASAGKEKEQNMHTWGAAFPTCRGDYFEEELSRVVEQSKLVLCGDYFGKAPARVETAVLSGRDAAEKLAKQMERGS